MGRGLRATTLLLLLAAPALADKFGPVIVEPRAAIGSPEVDSYFEYRFDVANPSAEPHVVTIEVEARMPYRSPQTARSSRSFALAPHSGGVVAVPQFLHVPYAARAARISVDGRRQPTELRLNMGVGEASGDDSSKPDVLVGRTVDLKPIHDRFEPASGDPIAYWLRTDAVAPTDWSTSWLQYDRFEGIVLTAADWGELPPPVQAAILRWVSAGGSLLFIGRPEEMKDLQAPAAKPPQMTWFRYGFGQINAVASEESITENFMNYLRGGWRRIGGRLAPTQTMAAMPLTASNGVPGGALFSVLVLFAVAGGPLNMFLLARRNQRVWVFWTLPLLAAVASVAVLGATMFTEGWQRVQRSESLTLLDEARHEATTIGWTGIYATLAPSGGVRFDVATEARPLLAVGDHTTDWTDGQRMLSGWVKSRYPTYLAVRKSEPRRERLPVRRAGASLLALNGLGGRIAKLWVAGDGGIIYTANGIAPGAEVVLVNSGRRVAVDAKEPGQVFGPVDSWSGYADRIGNEPANYLRRGSYIAIVEGSPFIETALEGPTKVAARGVVIGLMPGGGGAH